MRNITFRGQIMHIITLLRNCIRHAVVAPQRGIHQHIIIQLIDSIPVPITDCIITKIIPIIKSIPLYQSLPIRTFTLLRTISRHKRDYLALAHLYTTLVMP